MAEIIARSASKAGVKNIVMYNISKTQEVGKTEDSQTIWRCRICGYEYVGEELPDDFICPLCKHPASDFEKVVKKTEVKEMAENKYVGTQTEKNLQEAFAGESQARNKYTYFASVAKKEGYEQMSALFLKTADNEKEHAKMWFKELAGIGDTKENLAAAAEGENYEWTDMDSCNEKESSSAAADFPRNFSVPPNPLRLHSDTPHGT